METNPTKNSVVRQELLGGQRAAFNVPSDIAYFNTAYLPLQLYAVRAAGMRALERRGRPWMISAADWFDDVERLRALFATILGTDAEGVAQVPATSYGFAVAARNLPLRAGQRILVLDEEYPSGVYSWRAAARRSGGEILTVTRESGQTWAQAVLAALDERVAIVSVPNVHWTDGALVELAPIARRCRELGARLVIDGSQSVGAMPLDIDELKPDFLVTVGYKWLLGPYSVSYMYVAEEHRQGEPLEENSLLRVGSEDFARLVDYRDKYLPGARRFDVGQFTKFELIPMAIAGLEQIVEWQVDRVAATLSMLTADIARRAAHVGLSSLPDDERGPHILGVRLPKTVSARVLPALAQANCFAAVRGTSLRISPHLHITDEDVKTLFSALTKVMEDDQA
jgi:selenocysteine lyase/cysteine desulfurase